MAGNLTPHDVGNFINQFAVFTSGGLTPLNALSAAAGSSVKAEMEDVILALKSGVEGGESIADACRRYPTLFDALFCAVVEAGEADGRIPESLAVVTDYQQNVKERLVARSSEPYSLLDMALALRVLGILIAAGIDLYRALSIAAENMSHGEVSRVLIDIRQRVASGSHIHEAFAGHPDLFDYAACNLVEKGFSSGNLTLAFERVSAYLETLNSGHLPGVESDDIALFLRNIVRSMEGGLSFNRALREAADDFTYSPTLRSTILTIAKTVEGGDWFANACSQFPQYFDDRNVSGFVAGEVSGNTRGMITMLNHVASQIEERDASSAEEANPTVFISHSSHDKDVVEGLLIPTLENAGINCWYSSVTIQSASEWERSILAGLEACDWFLIVMSADALESEWVKDELFWAIDNRKDKLVPVLADETDPGAFHIRMRRLQVIDLKVGVDFATTKLLDAFHV